MKCSICFFLVTLALTARSQEKKISEDSLIKKWELATVNIEATTSLFMEPEVQKSLNNGHLNGDQMRTLTRNKFGSSGTAIFIKYENIHFLITARHVLEDPHFPRPG